MLKVNRMLRKYIFAIFDFEITTLSVFCLTLESDVIFAKSDERLLTISVIFSYLCKQSICPFHPYYRIVGQKESTNQSTIAHCYAFNCPNENAVEKGMQHKSKCETEKRCH